MRVNELGDLVDLNDEDAANLRGYMAYFTNPHESTKGYEQIFPIRNEWSTKIERHLDNYDLTECFHYHVREVLRRREQSLRFKGVLESVQGLQREPFGEVAPKVEESPPKLPWEIVKIGIDIGGVLSKYPKVMKPILSLLLSSPLSDVFILTDMPHDKAMEMLQENGIHMLPTRVHSCDYKAHGEMCKAVKAKELGLHVMIDDHMGYVSVPGSSPVRLLVMPDPSEPYYADEWWTGKDDSFGRRTRSA